MDPRTYFYFYFPEERDAQRAAAELTARGFEVDVRLSADDVKWLAFARKTLSEGELDVLEAEFEELGQALGGEYDGYERPVEPRPPDAPSS